MIELSSISKTYNGTPILENISFSIKKNEILAILGPNGSGKTTLYKILSGMIHPSQGSIFYQGMPTDQIFLRSLTGYCPQNTIAWKNLRLREQLYYLKSIQKNNSEIPPLHVENLIESLKLQDVSHKYIHEISGGMQKRFSIAMSLIKSPKILILDEPTNGLDIHSKISIRNLLNSLMEKNDITILISSHDLLEIQHISNRYLFLKNHSVNSVVLKQDSTNLEELYLDLYKEEN